jgi:hypothetical protein
MNLFFITLESHSSSRKKVKINPHHITDMNEVLLSSWGEETNTSFVCTRISILGRDKYITVYGSMDDIEVEISHRQLLTKQN